MRHTAFAAAAALALSGCTAGQVIENTGDVVAGTAKVAGRTAVGATRIAVRGAAGATRLAARGTIAGVRRLREPRAGYEAGTEVCVNQDGEVLGRVEFVDDVPTCFLDDPAAT